jgi:biopolymer transport protein ExbB
MEHFPLKDHVRRNPSATLPRTLVGMITVLLVAAAIPALAQDGSAGDGVSAGSLAEAFFVSRQTHQDGSKSIELFGSLIIWSLLALSVASIGLIGHLALTNQRKAIMPAGVVEEVSKQLSDSRFKEAMTLTAREESFFSKALNAGLSEASNGYSAMIRGLELASDELTTIRLRRIEYLNVLGQVSPMIGLFGTVYGMILAFWGIVQSGGTANPVLLAHGISTALTTTFWGLIVAIPALAAYAILRNRIDALTTEATSAAEHLINQFRPRAARPPRPAPEPKPDASPVG